MQRHTILLVDTDPLIDRVHLPALKALGFQVSTATDSATALAILASHGIDLVIGDAGLLRPDPISVLAKARKLHPRIKFVVTCADADVSDIIEMFRAGVDDCLQKPFTPEELKHRVNKLFPDNRLAAPDRPRVGNHGTQGHHADLFMTAFHDIRTATVCMTMMLNRLIAGRYGNVDEDVAMAHYALLAYCNKLTGMSEEFYTKFRLEDGEIMFRGESLDLLSDIIAPVLSELHMDIRKKGVEIDNFIPADLASSMTRITGDRVWLKAAFRNLFKNAIGHGTRGCTIGYDLVKLGDHYRVSVFNSGLTFFHGRPEALFNKSKLPTATPQGDTGMGLGLYLTKRIIHLHGGRIWYKYKNNASHFVFTIPDRCSAQETGFLPHVEIAAGFPGEHRPIFGHPQPQMVH